MVVEPRKILGTTTGDGSGESVHAFRDTDKSFLHPLEVA
jgi:hypothetical protein